MMPSLNPTVLVPLVSKVPDVSAKWNIKDYLGTFRVRWGIKRNSYRVDPGIYKIGNPDRNSDIFVSANYKLSFDILRKNLEGISAWILVLDTKGINVWCAAGKGTFGNNELIRRIKLTSLNEIVTHRRIILPQLGAVGIAAHSIKKQTGFRVIYGPVRASDIPEFISNGYKANQRMRTVQFNLYDRLKLIPVELIVNKFYLLGALLIAIFISGFCKRGYALSEIINQLPDSILYVLAAYASGLILAPLLLPCIPVRSFALKGFIMGALTYLVIIIFIEPSGNLPEDISWFLMVTAGSSFLTLNFTGTSTFTSLSGVKKEMKYAIPAQIGFIVAGIILLVVKRLFDINFLIQ